MKRSLWSKVNAGLMGQIDDKQGYCGHRNDHTNDDRRASAPGPPRVAWWATAPAPVRSLVCRPRSFPTRYVMDKAWITKAADWIVPSLLLIPRT